MLDMATIGRMQRAAARLAAIAVVSAALIPPAAASRQGSPEAIVSDYYATLLQVMTKAKTLGFEGRYNKLEPVVQNTFDLGFIARAAVGRHWRKLGHAQRAKLVAEFGRLSVATYAARFDDYAGEQFKVLETVVTKSKDRLVKTQIVRSNGKKIAINYLLRKRDGRWRVIDVFLKGRISEVATRRADFSAVIRRDGYDALISAIGAKVRRLRSE